MTDTTKIINCPACGKEMTKIFMSDDGVNLDICLDGCGGIFFDNRELKKFDEQSENIEELKQAIQGKTFEKTDENLTRICPVCGTNMVKNSVSIKGNIIIDECYACGGKFLDHGELTAIRNEYENDLERTNDVMRFVYNEIGVELIRKDAEEAQRKRSPLQKLFNKMIGL